MLPLNRLERAVLEKICKDTGVEGLAEQIKDASVESRINTGAGFYTKLLTGKGDSLSCGRVIGNVWAHVAGLKQPMTFLLFVDQGFIRTLEGASIDDSTIGIDFLSVDFEIIQKA